MKIRKVSINRKKMLSFFFIYSAHSLIPSEECPKYSNTDCTNCLDSIGNLTCGWCSETKSCIPGDIQGPFQGTCVNWYVNASDATCIKESSIALPLTARIIVGCCSGVIAIGTFIFWLFIFPRIFAAKPDQNNRSVI